MQPRITRKIFVGNVAVGGGAPVSIQSMTNTDTRDAAATLAQIRGLAAAGCQIVRVAVPDRGAVAALPEIVGASPLPVVADIHFDYRLALGAVSAGVHGIRLNPGNIGDEERVRMVAEAAGAADIPIRVGANSGSLPAGILETGLAKGMSRDDALAEALVESALSQCSRLEKYGFGAIKVSLKASDVAVTFNACRRFAGRTDYPLHIGVTEAGTVRRGIVKSSAGIGALLLLGIGETVRVSLTADPEEEVRTALILLESLGLREAMPEIISCPSCGRSGIDLIGLACRVEALIDAVKAEGKRINLRKIAVMGCEVNGPGEARDADLGIAGGKNRLTLFSHGEIIGSYSEDEGFERFAAAVREAAGEDIPSDA